MCRVPAGRKAAYEAIRELVLSWDLSRFTQREYEDSLGEFTRRVGEVFAALREECGGAAPEDNDLEELCGEILEAVALRLAAKGKFPFWNRRGLLLDQYRQVIALYLNPAVVKLALPEGERFTGMLREKWMERYPKYPYQLAEEREIAQGFGRDWISLFRQWKND